MKCREFVEFIIDYLEGELPPDQAKAFKEHLDLCPPCVEYVATYKTTIEIEHTCCKHDEAPPEMPERLVQAILKARKAGGGGEACDGAGGVAEE